MKKKPSKTEKRIMIIGAGLAGSEAAWQAARRGIGVDLYEMRPGSQTPAHQTGFFAELVCSNSLRANHLQNAAGLLKEEMRRLDSLIIKTADRFQVPAGRALAVDREGFAAAVTAYLEDLPLVKIIRQEIKEIPDAMTVIVATGPLTSEDLAEAIEKITGEEYLFFYDAAAPIITDESINYDVVFRASRYEGDEGDYLNCPMNREEYLRFWEALVKAERHTPHQFEEEKYFEGCLPVEVIAERGRDTLRYGPLKPVGLTDPRTGKRPYAVVQLRQDNARGTLYNLVGFQTRLSWGEQQRVFRMIPGLEDAEIVRYGVMHRNTYLNSPHLLEASFRLRSDKLSPDRLNSGQGLFFAGQLTGVEGYVESAASGLIAGINAARNVEGEEPLVFPAETAHGALSRYISDPGKDVLQPMNINFGLLPPLEERVRDKWLRKEKISRVSLEELESFKEKNRL